MRSSRFFGPALALCGLLAFGTSALAAGEEPKGFLDSSWGTSQETMTKSLPTTVQSGANVANKTIACKNYYVGDVPITDLVLSFGPNGTLSGYTMMLPHDSYQKIRAAIIDKLGQPNSSPGLGEMFTWQWPSGTTAGLQERCNSFSVSCFGLWTKPLMDWNSKDEAIQNERRKKGF